MFNVKQASTAQNLCQTSQIEIRCAADAQWRPQQETTRLTISTSNLRGAHAAKLSSTTTSHPPTRFQSVQTVRARHRSLERKDATFHIPQNASSGTRGREERRAHLTDITHASRREEEKSSATQSQEKFHQSAKTSRANSSL